MIKIVFNKIVPLKKIPEPQRSLDESPGVVMASAGGGEYSTSTPRIQRCLSLHANVLPCLRVYLLVCLFKTFYMHVGVQWNKLRIRIS